MKIPYRGGSQREFPVKGRGFPAEFSYGKDFPQNRFSSNVFFCSIFCCNFHLLWIGGYPSPNIQFYCYKNAKQIMKI